MGFSIKSPSPAQTKAPLPVIADTQESDTAADLNQRQARRRGLLSAIIAGNGKNTSGGAMTRHTSDGSTLG